MRLNIQLDPDSTTNGSILIVAGDMTGDYEQAVGKPFEIAYLYYTKVSNPPEEERDYLYQDDEGNFIFATVRHHRSSVPAKRYQPGQNFNVEILDH